MEVPSLLEAYPRYNRCHSNFQESKIFDFHDNILNQVFTFSLT